MWVYLLKRLMWAAITVFLVVTVVFCIFFVLPGGSGRRPRGGFSPVAVLLAGRNRTPQTMRRIERDLGLDRPVYVQYELYVTRLAHGDLGYSYAFGAPVGRIIAPAIPATASIAIGASLVWVAAGTVIGVTSALKRGRWMDRFTMGLALAALSIPVFVVGSMGIVVVLQVSGVYAANRYVPITENPVAWLQAMVLPWICLAFPLTAIYARMVRASVLEVGGQDYIKTSVGKGLDDKDVLRHTLRGALTPVVTMYGLDFGTLLGGSVIIERIFRIPGLGSVLLQARDLYDFPVLSAVVIFASVAVIMANLGVDLLYGVLDPRVRGVASGTRAGRVVPF